MALLQNNYRTCDSIAESCPFEAGESAPEYTNQGIMAELAGLRNERDRCLISLQEAEAHQRQLQDSYEAEIRQLRSERDQQAESLEQVRGRLGNIEQEKVLVEADHAATVKTLHARLESHLAEKRLWGTLAEHFKKKTRTAFDRIRHEHETLKTETDSLREKLDTIRTKTMKGPDHPSPFTIHAVSMAAVEINSADPLTPLGAGAPSGLGARLTDSVFSGSSFRHDPTVTAIEYHSPNEIIELHGSSNVVQSAPGGYRAQRCSASVCGLDRKGTVEVFAAWYLAETGDVVICVPERQPGDRDEFRQTLREALHYFECVGFFMDRIELAKGSLIQLQTLEKIGVCRQLVQSRTEMLTSATA